MTNQKEETIRLEYPEEACTGSYEVIRLNEYHFLLRCNDPFIEALSYGTVIEAEVHASEKNTYVFKRIVEQSTYTSEVIFLPSQLNETELHAVGNLIEEAGGFWEVWFGGMACVNLPIGSHLNLSEALNDRITKKKNYL